MTFIPKQQDKHCFIACSEDKIKAGLCDCVNKLRNQQSQQQYVCDADCPDIQFGNCCHPNNCQKRLV